MDLTIIGGGRAAWTFSLLARGRNAKVRLLTRHAPDPAFLRLGGLRAAPLDDVRFEASEVVLFAVPDGAIPELYDLNQPRIPQTCTVFHASGARSSDLFERHPRRFSLHPLRALPAVGTSSVDLSDTLFTWEGAAETRELAETLVLAAGGRFASIATDQKSLYHAGAVFGSNYVAVVLEQAAGLLRAAGLEAPERDLRALALSAIDNWSRQDGPARFTGPLRRGEVDVIRGHLETLSTHAAARASYRALAAALIEALSSQSGEASELHEIRRLIEGSTS